MREERKLELENTFDEQDKKKKMKEWKEEEGKRNINIKHLLK